MTKPDPIVAALDAAVASANTGSIPLIDRTFEARPEVFASILAAHKRGVPMTEIARLLTAGAPAGVVISDGQVKTWLKKHQPKTLS